MSDSWSCSTVPAGPMGALGSMVREGEKGIGVTADNLKLPAVSLKHLATHLFVLEPNVTESVLHLHILQTNRNSNTLWITSNFGVGSLLWEEEFMDRLRLQPFKAWKLIVDMASRKSYMNHGQTPYEGIIQETNRILIEGLRLPSCK